MHFNICFKGVSGKIGIFHNEKLPIEVFFDFFASLGLGNELELILVSDTISLEILSAIKLKIKFHSRI